MITQDDYTSRRTHNKLGFGFTVCLSCYSKKLRDERAAYTKFEEGLRQRLGLVCGAVRLKSISVPDTEDIQISFSRSLPVNEMEAAQMVRTLSGLVPEDVLNMQKAEKLYAKKSLYSQATQRKTAKAESI